MPAKRTAPPVESPLEQERAELALRQQWLDLQQAFYAAKARVEAGTIKRDSKEYRDAKRKFSEFRTYWRRIGEAVGTRVPVGSSREG